MLGQDTIRRHLAEGSVGFPTAIASTVGLIMAAPVLLTATSGFGIGGDAFAVAMLIALVLMLAQATTFAEAACLIPTTGSVYDYLSCGLGRFWALTGAISAYVLVCLFAGTAETILSGTLAVVNFESLSFMVDEGGSAWMIGAGMMVFFAFINMLGISWFSRAEVFLTFSMFATLMTFAVAGLLKAPAVELDGWFGGAAGSLDLATVLPLIGMAMFMFVGCEFVTPLTPELRNATRTLPRSMLMGLLGVGSCMFLYGAAVTSQVANIPLTDDGSVRMLDTPMAIPMFAEQVMGEFGRIWLGIGLLLAGAATINTIMAGLPRILYGMAQDGALPRVFTYLHPRFKTPVVCILFTMLIPITHAWWLGGNLDAILPLVLAAVCAWGTAYLLVNLAVVVLRVRRPDLPRPYRSPLFPLPQLVSTVGILLGLFYITPPGMDPSAIYLPFGVMLGGTALYALCWTLWVQKVNPFKPVPIEEVLQREFGEHTSARWIEVDDHAVAPAR